MAIPHTFYNGLQVQDVEIKETTVFTTMEKISENTSIKNTRAILVYNPSNMEAVLATALIKQSYPNVEVYEAGVDLPIDGEQYLWLGVVPTTAMFPPTHGLKVWRNSQHYVATSGQPVRQFKVKLFYVGQDVANVKDDLDETPLNMVGNILNFLGIHATQFRGLIDLVHLFYERSLDIDTIAYIYDGVKRAQTSLITGEFTLNPPSIEQVESYMFAVQEAKSALNNNYSVRDLIVGKTVSKVILTCNSKELWITRRLTSFSYQNFANSLMTLNGPSVQTNLNVTKLFKQEAVTVLN